MDKQTVENTIEKLRQMARFAIQRQQENQALNWLSEAACIQYQWNQNYADPATETMLGQIAASIRWPGLSMPKTNTVLFYDAFGLDTRGLALIYLSALCDLGYHVVYVVPESARGHQPEICRAVAGQDIAFKFISAHYATMEWAETILRIVSQEQPGVALFYSKPDDTAGCVAFQCLAGKVERYQINLTDHAFWLGVNAFDYCLEFRDYGASVSQKYRGIALDKMLMAPYYPILSEFDWEGYPYDRKAGDFLIFSGGSIYKTIDEEKTYYRLVRDVLDTYSYVKFWYCSNTSCPDMDALLADYPGRVFLTPERKDLMQVIRHADMYLNTYPLIGGLMTQYAAMAGKAPFTLMANRDEGSDELLLNREQLAIYFGDLNDMVQSIGRYITDVAFRDSLDASMKGTVITPEEFAQNLKLILTQHKSLYPLHPWDIDTADFLAKYVKRFTYKDLANSVVSKATFPDWRLWLAMPGIYTRGLWVKAHKIKNLFCKGKI